MNEQEQYDYVKYILLNNPVNLREVKYFTGEVEPPETYIRRGLYDIPLDVWKKAFADVKDEVSIEFWISPNHYSDYISYQEYVEREPLRYVYFPELYRWEFVDDSHPQFSKGFTQHEYHEMSDRIAIERFMNKINI